MKPAPIIVIEGIDRVGKTLQAERLVRGLLESGIQAELFSTPDYGEFGGQLISNFLHQRAIVVTSLEGVDKFPTLSSETALECLQICNRYAVAERIREATSRGVIAVCVRWWQSSLLYGQSDGLDEAWIRRACSFLPVADLNILLSVDPTQVRERASDTDRYESDLGRQLLLAGAYEKLWRSEAEANGSAWKFVDGGHSVVDVAAQVAFEVGCFLERRVP